MPQSVCLTVAVAGDAGRSPASSSNATGALAPDELELAVDARGGRRRPAPSVDRNSIVEPLSTSSSIVCSMLGLVVVAECHASRRFPLARASSASASSVSEICAVSAPSSSVALQEVTSMTRLWPAFAAAPPFASGLDRSVALSGPSVCVPGIGGMDIILSIRDLIAIVTEHMNVRSIDVVELDHQFSTGKPLEESWAAILDLDGWCRA